MQKVRTLFIGTGEFAIPVLAKLLELEFIDVVGVITQPDKPVGRKQELTAGPLKRFLISEIPDQVREDKSLAQGDTLKLFQPEKLRLEADQILQETQSELIIVAAYGQMIPDSMLNFPKYKCLNLHGSLLPKLRGAVPVPMAILQGLTETGVTIQQMAAELDAGPILAEVKVGVEDFDTAESLMQKLREAAASLLATTLPDWISGKLAAVPQDDSQATFCYQSDIAKEKAEITYNTPVEVAERMVRAFYPWPVAYVEIKEQRTKNQNTESEGKSLMLKIFKARIETELEFSKTETLSIHRSGKRLFLTLENGVLELLEVQLEGKVRRNASDYLFLAEND